MMKKIMFSCPYCGTFEFGELSELCCDECGKIIEEDINGEKAFYGSKLFCPGYGVNSFAAFACPKCRYPLYEIICDLSSKNKRG